jgi:hypothetical protein
MLWMFEAINYSVNVDTFDLNKEIILESYNLNKICCSFNIHAQRHQERSEYKKV